MSLGREEGGREGRRGKKRGRGRGEVRREKRKQRIGAEEGAGQEQEETDRAFCPWLQSPAFSLSGAPSASRLSGSLPSSSA